ncbi:MAG: sigma-70 family RNA polymerase sigma factor [Planctomycetota bacterium]
MHDLTTSFIARLRARDGEAWFELWEIFGPVLRSQLARWGRGRIGFETVQDLSQDTMVALASAIDRHDPSRGARFSTWLLAIAKYTLGDEMDRRGALKRGGGVKPIALDGLENAEPGSADLAPDASYELEVFDAKIEAALRRLERDADLLDFETFRMRVLEGQSGKSVAQSLGTSEPTVSRRLARARARLQEVLFDVFARFSFTEEEWEELERNGIGRLPNKTEDAAFDEAVAEIYARIAARRAEGAAGPSHSAEPSP